MNFSGIIAGAVSFLIIGILHPVVIRAEYHFGTRCWPVFAVSGTVCCVISLLIQSDVLSILLAIPGFALFWSIHELQHQEKRVSKGWYPANPKRTKAETMQQKKDRRVGTETNGTNQIAANKDCLKTK